MGEDSPDLGRSAGARSAEKQRAGSLLEGRVFRYIKEYQGALALPTGLLHVVSLVLVVASAALLARVGTNQARLAAGGGLVLALVVSLAFVFRRRQLWRQTHRALFEALRRVEASQAASAQRAYRLWQQLESQGVEARESPGLAAHQLGRVLDKISLSKVVSVAKRRRNRLMLLGGVLGAGTLALFVTRPLSVVEGIDVLLARRGEGPFPIAYIAGVSVRAELPSYLNDGGKKRFVSPRLSTVPQGSDVEVRVVPQVSERELLLTDGLSEVPFISDGKGALVARWKAADATLLRVAARFGDVLLYDAHETHLNPLDDSAPVVLLQQAPARLKLADLESLSLAYAALDDHGLTQIDLVLRSGQRIIRHELAHLDGQNRTYQGAYTLTKEHELLKRAFLPVRVSIEARDTNSATGPSWGKSEAIVLIPEPLGREVARQQLRLRAFRQSVTNFLAADVRASHLPLRAAREARTEALSVLDEAFEDLALQLTTSNHLPRRSLGFIEAQLEALERKGEERADPESVLLATDALIQGLSTRQARQLAKDLGAAVEEIAVQAREIRMDTDRIKLVGLVDSLLGAKEGAKQLKEVGVLGLDLGSVALADLARVERSLDAKAYDRAEAAALHLAERLAHGTPSFSSKGGGGVEAGVPEGSSSGSPSEQSEGQSEGESNAPAEFEELARKVDDLAQEAASELSELERMLREAQRAAEADFRPSEELGDAMAQLREALRRLPRRSYSPGGVQAEAASARSQGEAMAEALEAGDLAEGLERGRDAKSAIQRAIELMKYGQSWLEEDDLEAAHSALREAMVQAEKAATELGRKSQASLNESLKKKAEQERSFAERAGQLSRRGREAHAPLSGQSVESLEKAAHLFEEAAAEMAGGRAEKGAELAGEAQAQLEQALPEPQGGQESEGGEEGDSRGLSFDGSVPKQERDKAQAFRARVDKGLGRKSGRLAPSVRRYAEELK